MNAKEISEKHVSAVNVRAAEIAIVRSRMKLQYNGALRVRWFLTTEDRSFATTRGAVFNAPSPYAFVPVKEGTPEIWLRASKEPEMIASVVFHEMSHVPDVQEVHHRENLAKTRGLKANDDHWAAWLYRQSYSKSEDKAHLFQNVHYGEAEFIGALARKSVAG